MAEAISMLDFWLAEHEITHATRSPRERCKYWLEEIRSAEAQCRDAFGAGDHSHVKEMGDVLVYLASELVKEATHIAHHGEPDGDEIAF